MSDDFYHQGDPFPHPLIEGQATSQLSASQRLRGLIAVLASLMAAGITFGTSIPLLSLLLERRGVSTSMIGLNTSMPVLATVLFSPFIPSIVARFGTYRSMMAGIALIIVSFLLLPIFQSLEMWFVLRFLIGIGMSVHWIVSETWLNSATTSSNRGLYAGLYATLMGAGFAFGPVLLTFIDIDGWTPFLIITGAIAMAAIPLTLAIDCAPKLEMSAPSERWSAIRKAPTIFIAVFISGLSETNLMSLMPIYGLQMGLPQTEAVLLAAVAIAGAVCLQLPIGWLNDRMNRHTLLITSGLIGFAGALALPFILEPEYLRWPVLFLWGGVAMGLYTIGLAELGDRFTNSALSGANALYVMTYCLGSMAGPPIAGALMDGFGPNGFPITLIGAFSIFLVIATLRTVARKA